MSSNPAISLATSKSTYPVSQIASPSQQQSGSILPAETHSQRRIGGSVSFGVGSSSRIQPTARQNQSFRKQHKGQRRPRLADEDAAAESVAMQSSSSRKGRTSITHLMNFALPPRPQTYQHHHLGRHARKNPTWGLGSGYHAADKAKYVHANYRFIVNPNGNYRAQAIDADVHLDWTDVLQILVSAQSQSSSCPICLSTPVAPRMAKCGHIFCLPCLIRYMHSSDETNPTPEKRPRWKKCPICWDSVYTSETRPVRWFTGQEGERPQEGADVVLRLITRQPGSTLALPRDGAEILDKEEVIPWFFAAEVMDYARIMKGSADYMREQYETEIEELQHQEREDELMFGEEAQWTKKAVTAILEAQERIKNLENPPTAPKKPSERKSRRPPVEYNTDIPEHYLIQHAARSGQSWNSSFVGAPSRASGSLSSVPATSTSVSPVESNTPHTLASTVSTSSSRSDRGALSMKSDIVASSRSAGCLGPEPRHHQNGSPYYFYEALLHYYLSPLDIRILKAAFGDFASFPSTILPRIERVSTGHIVDDELRRRAKYLTHLPHGCEVGFLECNWNDIVPQEILAGFAPEIERRRKKNWEKEAREEKERVKAEKEEDDKRWAAVRRRRPASTQDIISDADFQPLPEASMADLTVSSSSPPCSTARTHGGSSFATLASPSTSPIASKTVWGTRIAAPVSPILNAISDEPEPLENDNWLQGWENDLLQEEGLIAQVEASTLEVSSYKQMPSSAHAKKKKGKKITLMSTNARRGA